jgi:hypothetical protein
MARRLHYVLDTAQHVLAASQSDKVGGARLARVPNGARLKAAPFELVGLFLLFTSYVLARGTEAEADLNVAGPFVLIVLLGVGAFLMVRRDSRSICTTLFWFRLSVIVYFGLGSIVPFIVDPQVLVYIRSFYNFDAGEIYKSNMIIALGTATVLSTSNIALRRGLLDPGGKMDRALPSFDPRHMLSVGLIFLAIGAIVQYGLSVPYQLKLTDYVLPGAVLTLTNLVFAAIFILTVWSIRYALWSIYLVMTLVLVEVVVGLVEFYKSDALIPLVIFGLAVLYTRITLVRGLLFGCAVLFLFQSIFPIVSQARDELVYRYGQYPRADIAERIDLLERAWSNPRQELLSGSNGVLSRLSYVNQSTFAEHLYDTGAPGGTLADAWAVFIPRWLWPNKPIITQIGITFNYLATGSMDSSAAPGFFAEAYWDYGWIGVIAVMALAGIIFGTISRFSLDVFAREQWIFLPVVLLGARIGMRSDGLIVPDLVGGSALAGSAYLALRVLSDFLTSTNRRHAAAAANRLRYVGRPIVPPQRNVLTRHQSN